MSTTNDYLVTGIPSGQTTQWLPPFQLLKYDGTVLFAVANDGTLTTTNNQIVANPSNFKATGTGEIDGNFSIGDAFGGSPTLKVTAASGNTVISGTLNVTGAFAVTAAKPILGATATPLSGGAGSAGMFTWDGSYLYICTATNTWARVAVTGSY
jgi:hypothetical protein